MGKLWALENEGNGKGKLNLAFVRRVSKGTQKGIGLGYLGTAKTMGFSGNAGRDQLGFGQLKGACSWTQGVIGSIFLLNFLPVMALSP